MLPVQDDTICNNSLVPMVVRRGCLVASCGDEGLEVAGAGSAVVSQSVTFKVRAQAHRSALVSPACPTFHV